MEAVDFSEKKGLPVFLLGGGSNVIISDEGFRGLVVRLANKGVEISQDDNHAYLKVSSGEVWDDVVELAVKNGWWGIENLSHIPGLAGAFAVQNVGAYGQEASQVIEEVKALELQSGQIETFTNAGCGFSYRQSIFNTSSKGRYAIISTVLKLEKSGRANLAYGDLKKRFEGREPSIGDVRKAIIDIRNGKFPFPSGPVNGSAGSFFKNPLLSESEYLRALETVGRGLGGDKTALLASRTKKDSGKFKLPAAFLIEIAGMKGFQTEHAAVNVPQPLVLLNKSGKAKAKDILELAEMVRQAVLEKTGVSLEREPVLMGMD